MGLLSKMLSEGSLEIQQDGPTEQSTQKEVEVLDNTTICICYPNAYRVSNAYESKEFVVFDKKYSNNKEWIFEDRCDGLSQSYYDMYVAFFSIWASWIKVITSYRIDNKVDDAFLNKAYKLMMHNYMMFIDTYSSLEGEFDNVKVDNIFISSISTLPPALKDYLPNYKYEEHPLEKLSKNLFGIL